MKALEKKITSPGLFFIAMNRYFTGDHDMIVFLLPNIPDLKIEL